ncbi:MAG: hypothetical protein IMY67_01815 [Bacteroidetes bacterium]|nr:hypothetical protein [Bacteroidota bacterium]
MFEKEILNKSVEGLTEVQAKGVMTLLANSTKAYDEKLINKTVGETYGKFDEIAKNAGFEIESGKTTEFIMNQFADAKARKAENIELLAKIKSSSSEGLIELQEEIKRLKANGGKKYEQANKDLQIQLTGKTEAFEAYRIENETKFQEQGLKHQTALIKNALMSKMPAIKSGLSPLSTESSKIESVNEILKESYLDENGKLVFKNESGETLMNPNNSNSPYSPEEMFLRNPRFMEIADIGNNNSGINIKDKLDGKQTQTVSNFKTKDELYAHLRNEQGLSGEAFQDAYNEQVKLIK